MRPTLSRSSPLAALACVLAIAACGDDPGTAAPAAAPSPSTPESAAAAPASSDASAAPHARETAAPAVEPAGAAAEVDNPDLVLERRSPDVRPGSVRGRVVLRGTPPAAASFSIDAKLMEECCGPDVDPTDRSLLVDAKGGLANAVVELMMPGDLARGSGPAVALALERCQFAPRVALVPVGTPLALENRDRGVHQVRVHAVRNPASNFTLSAGARHEILLGSPERVRVSSELVPWAAAWVIATDSRWVAVTASDGSFELADVPRGEYALRAWHEVLGEVVLRDVTIGGGQAPQVEIAFER